MSENQNLNVQHYHGWRGSVVSDLHRKTMRYSRNNTLCFVWYGSLPTSAARISAYLLYVASCYNRNLSSAAQPPDLWLRNQSIMRTIAPDSDNEPFTVGHPLKVVCDLENGAITVKGVPVANGRNVIYFRPTDRYYLEPIATCMEQLAAYYGAGEAITMQNFVQAFREARANPINDPVHVIN